MNPTVKFQYWMFAIKSFDCSEVDLIKLLKRVQVPTVLFLKGFISNLNWSFSELFFNL